jgi:hypothetical protein
MNPLSLDPYLFADNNPITGMDPTGLLAIPNPLGSGWIQVGANDARQIHDWLSSECIANPEDPQLQETLHNDALLLEGKYGEAAGPVGGETASQLEQSGALMVTSTNSTPGVGATMKVQGLSSAVFTPTSLGWWATAGVGSVVLGGAIAACAVGGCAAVAASVSALVGVGATAPLVEDVSADDAGADADTIQSLVRDATHNADSPLVSLGKYIEGDPSSYDQIGYHLGYTYFSRSIRPYGMPSAIRGPLMKRFYKSRWSKARRSC